MDMDIEDVLGLSAPDNNFVDIEESESETSDDDDVKIVRQSEKKSSDKINLRETSDDVEIIQEPEKKSPEKINLSDVLENICQRFSVKIEPTSWPFLVGNLVCFRPTKSSEWFDGKIEEKLPGADGEEFQFVISVVNNPAVSYHVPDRRSLIKSNAHTAETLNSLDLQLQPRKPPRAFKSVEKDKVGINKNVKNSRKVKVAAAEKQVKGEAQEDLLTDTMVRVNNILKTKSSSRLACVDDKIKITEVTEEVNQGPATVRGSKTLEERICEMFEDSRDNKDISRRIEDEDMLFGLLESEKGRDLLLTVARTSQLETLSRVWHHLQPVALALIVREETCGLMEKLVEERPEIFQLGADMRQMKLMIRTPHCIGLVRVIAERASDDWLVKMTRWIIADLKNLILNIASIGPTIILEELISKLPMSLQSLNKCLLQAEGLWTGLRRLWMR